MLTVPPERPKIRPVGLALSLGFFAAMLLDRGPVRTWVQLGCLAAMGVMHLWRWRRDKRERERGRK